MQIIPLAIEPEVSRYAYLLIHGDQSILIDPGSSSHVPMLLKALNAHIRINDLHTIIVQSNDLLNLTSIPHLIEAGFEGTIIAQEGRIPYLEPMLNHHIVSIDMMDEAFRIGDDLEFHFITTPFLPYPEGFMTYESHSKTLFSAHLCSQDQRSSDDPLIHQIHRFHEQVLPGVEFIRQAVRKLKPYEIEVIYPRLGEPIMDQAIEPVIYGITHYDFYHTNQVILKRNQKNVTYHYEMILNHMLKKLETVYHRKDISDVFDHSQITLKMYPMLEIDQTALTGYKLWHYFFERIHEKRGLTWLAILEPVVRMYHKKYHIQMPSIYRLKSFRQQTEILKLNEQSDKLAEQVKSLESQISQTTDKLLRCPITGLYNERFMKEHITSLLSTQSQELPSMLVLIQIDGLLELNRKYSKLKGDETLKHLVYVLNNQSSEHLQYFKQNGPGIYLFAHEMNHDDLMRYLLETRELVQSSKVFVEPVTLSISIASTKEYDKKNTEVDLLSFLMTNVLKRMEHAKRIGHEQIIDKDDDDTSDIDGSILLVDEDETYQNLMVTIFKRIHYQVIIAKDIDHAQALLKKHSIDIILSEINMSKLDGFQFKHMLNQSKAYRHIPFIMVSHLKNQDVVQRANKLNVDWILQKPIIPDELIGYVHRMRQKKV